MVGAIHYYVKILTGQYHLYGYRLVFAQENSTIKFI
jgi:hypothetical protein